jgi:hypothetical protein
MKPPANVIRFEIRVAALKEDREQEGFLLSQAILFSRAWSSQERVRLPAAIHSEAGNFAARINELCN